jgi:hypothetical protein
MYECVFDHNFVRTLKMTSFHINGYSGWIYGADCLLRMFYSIIY